MEEKYNREVNERETLERKLEKKGEKKRKVLQILKKNQQDLDKMCKDVLNEQRKSVKYQNDLLEKDSIIEELSKRLEEVGRENEHNKSKVSQLQNDLSVAYDRPTFQSQMSNSDITNDSVASLLDKSYSEEVQLNNIAAEKKIKDLQYKNTLELAKFERKFTQVETEKNKLLLDIDNQKSEIGRFGEANDQLRKDVEMFQSMKNDLKKMFEQNLLNLEMNYESKVFLLEKKLQFYKLQVKDIDQKIEDKFVHLSEENASFSKKIKVLEARELRQLTQLNEQQKTMRELRNS